MTEDREKLVIDNMPLALFVAKRYRDISLEYDDVVQCAYMGLVKAANTYDFNREIKFATYSVTIMTNEILMQYRRESKHRAVIVSLDAPTVSGEDVVLMDIIPDHRNQYKAVETVFDATNRIRDLDDKEKEILLIKIENPGINQAEIGNIVGVSQSIISRYLKNIRQKCLKVT